MSDATDRSGRRVRVRSSSDPGMGVVAIAAALGLIAVVGIFGRLVPSPARPGIEPQPTVSAAADEHVARILSPVANVVWLRTTEIRVRGTVPAGIEAVEAVVRVRGEPLGQSTFRVDAGGRFDGLVQVVPPAVRTPAVAEVRAAGGDGELLGRVEFSLQAGAELLVRRASDLAGEAGDTVVVDILVYADVREVRGLLTDRSGTLIARTEKRVPPGRQRFGEPRIVALELALPGDAAPGRAWLHVLGIGEDGSEIEHIDMNFRLSPGP